MGWRDMLPEMDRAGWRAMARAEVLVSDPPPRVTLSRFVMVSKCRSTVQRIRTQITPGTSGAFRARRIVTFTIPPPHGKVTILYALYAQNPLTGTKGTKF